MLFNFKLMEKRLHESGMRAIDLLPMQNAGTNNVTVLHNAVYVYIDFSYLKEHQNSADWVLSIVGFCMFRNVVDSNVQNNTP